MDGLSYTWINYFRALTDGSVGLPGASPMGWRKPPTKERGRGGGGPMARFGEYRNFAVAILVQPCDSGRFVFRRYVISGPIGGYSENSIRRARQAVVGSILRGRVGADVSSADNRRCESPLNIIYHPPHSSITEIHMVPMRNTNIGETQ